MGDNFRYSEYSNSRAVGEQYPAEHQYPPGQPVSGQAWSSVEPCQPVAGQAWGGVESGNGGRRGRGRGRGRGGFRGGRGRGNGAQGGNWSNGAQGGNWSNGAQGGNWSNGASDVTSRLQALAEPSAPAVDAQGRKRRFREIMDSDWTSNYDGHLPQEILSQCTVFSCGLCGIKFSSDVVQKDHYQGQHHDKKVQAALADIAAKTGTSVLKKKKVGLDVKVDSFLNIERLANWQKDYLDTWDTALPDELLQLVRPSRCELCLLDLSSNIVATSHLNGKNHDKKVKVWLDEYCKRNGKDVPKKKVLECSLQEKMCEYCNVELTSVTMAKSHYRNIL
ncbi:uncharacterized protein LOC111706191 [Eurytemora carolleeae]|uniref:uncharacterized protein LOC111706191 n=1 Tax=Eurytemora carolleeae TaxID=1294199 RepID=UPI000C7568E6|nr:uncharacterized protein LOC111706191 [Eurytemora carolleeae]|eukprot:XP_023334763.1 uncharacterized protein LOC111706191 [Eurytemora affinis]